MSSYPTAIDTAAALLQAVNNFATALSTDINELQTTIEIASSVGLPASGLVSIDSEVISYASISISGSLHRLHGCGRGADGTLAEAHGVGARVECRWVAAHHNLLAQAIRAIEIELGVEPRGAYSTVADRLAAVGPLRVAMSPAKTNWSFTHARQGLLLVQLWRKTGALTYELFTAPIEQSDGQVTIELPEAVEGYVVAM